MSDTKPSYTSEELRVLADAVDLWEKLLDLLQPIEAWPREWTLQIDTEIQPGHLGQIGYDESGTITFQPAMEEEVTT